MYRTFAFVLLSVTLANASAYAGEEATPSAATSATGFENAIHSADRMDWSRRLTEPGDARRPSALPALYVSLAALQGFDAYSTRAGLARGAQEANPLVGSSAGNSAAFWALKAGSTAASIWFAERLWKRNRVGAIVTMVAVNGMMASVAARNASVLKELR